MGRKTKYLVKYNLPLKIEYMKSKKSKIIEGEKAYNMLNEKKLVEKQTNLDNLTSMIETENNAFEIIENYLSENSDAMKLILQHHIDPNKSSELENKIKHALLVLKKYFVLEEVVSQDQVNMNIIKLDMEKNSLPIDAMRNEIEKWNKLLDDYHQYISGYNKKPQPSTVILEEITNNELSISTKQSGNPLLDSHHIKPKDNNSGDSLSTLPKIPKQDCPSKRGRRSVSWGSDTSESPILMRRLPPNKSRKDDPYKPSRDTLFKDNSPVLTRANAENKNNTPGSPDKKKLHRYSSRSNLRTNK